jgi:ArsR family transcriptional regulator
MKIKESEDVFELHAEFCKVIANATRLKIVSVLRDGEQSVGRLAGAAGCSLANVSQHIRILRDHNVLRSRKEGRTVYYRLRDPRLVKACELTRNILLAGIQERGTLASRSETTPSPGDKVRGRPSGKAEPSRRLQRKSTPQGANRARRDDHDTRRTQKPQG